MGYELCTNPDEYEAFRDSFRIRARNIDEARKAAINYYLKNGAYATEEIGVISNNRMVGVVSCNWGKQKYIWNTARGVYKLNVDGTIKKS